MRVYSGGYFKKIVKLIRLKLLKSKDDLDIFINFNEGLNNSNFNETQKWSSLNEKYYLDYIQQASKRLKANNQDTLVNLDDPEYQIDTLIFFAGHGIKQQQFLLENQQKSHIKGWLANVLPEDWRGELEALRYHWLTNENKCIFWIEILTVFYFLDMLKGGLQIKIENKWLLKRKQS